MSDRYTKLDRKSANNFIKEYNQIVPMKRYSKMNIGQKNELIRKKIQTLQNNKLVRDYNELLEDQKIRDEDFKTTIAKKGSQKQKADAAKKKAAEKKAASAASQKNLTKIAQAQKKAKQRPVAQAQEIAGADKMSKQKRLEYAAAGKLQQPTKPKKVYANQSIFD